MFGFGQFGGFGMDVPQAGPGSYRSTYKCYSVSMCPGNDRQDVEKGGKIIMPPSALDTLTRLNIQYPMLFKLTNKKENRQTHCGVLEFVADEGRIYIPYWMMRNLLLDEGDLIQLESTSLPVATFAKFQPQSVDFLDITNPKAVLENCLRSFACLSTGDVIAIKYNDRLYEMNVLELKPSNAVSIIECDMNVDFAPPVGYVEPEKTSQPHKDETDSEMDVIETPQMLIGNRLDGKKKGIEYTAKVDPSNIKRGVPNYEYKKGRITFIRNRPKNTNADLEETGENFEPFSGEGQSIRKKKSRK